MLKSDEHVVATWLSPSGDGLKVLFYLEYDKQFPIADAWIYHEHCAFPQVDNYLRQTYGIDIDPMGGDITRLCFVSDDPDVHLKKEFQPFQVNSDLTKNKICKIRLKYYFGKKNVRNAFKEQRQIAKLLKQTSMEEENKSEICWATTVLL